jgi:hypothetical protein
MVIIRLVVGLLAVSLTLWAPISLLPIGIDRAYMNKHIKDIEGPHPDDVRNSMAMASQFVTMNIINLMAGALAGIGVSLFVDNGRLRWPSSQVPTAFIILSLALAEFTGIVILAYIARPTPRWITNPSVFRSYLWRLNERGRVSKNDLAEIRRLQSTWKTRTNAWPLRKRDELQALKLMLPMASQEWVSPVPCDPIRFGAELLTQVSRRQVRNWIFRKRLLRLGIPPSISGFALASIIWALISTSADLEGWMSILLLIAIGVVCIVLLCWLAFRIGRLDLVVVNRMFALEEAQLRDCGEQIDQIEKWHKRKMNSSAVDQEGSSDGQLVVRIGSWELFRHHNGGARIGHVDRGQPAS